MGPYAFEKAGNTWWVRCGCETWFPASEEIVHHSTVKMVCPGCGRNLDATTALDLQDPNGASRDNNRK